MCNNTVVKVEPQDALHCRYFVFWEHFLDMFSIDISVACHLFINNVM